jgi:hypothetical protein
LSRGNFPLGWWRQPFGDTDTSRAPIRKLQQSSQLRSAGRKRITKVSDLNEVACVLSSLQFLLALYRSCLTNQATSRRVSSSCPDEVRGFFRWSHCSGLTTALEFTHPVTAMSSKNLPGSKARPARKSEKLSTICELII